MSRNELNKKLTKTLNELDALVKQIHDTKDYSESNEYIAFLKELVLEQIQVRDNNEDSGHPAHQIR